MRALFLRHAEAEIKVSTDFDRELTPHGLSQIQQISISLQRLNLQNFEVYVSPSRRTSDTWDAICTTLHLSVQVHTVDELYDADTETYRKILESATGDGIAIVGHNPAISAIASELSGQHIALGTAEWVLLNLDASRLTGEVIARYQ